MSYVIDINDLKRARLTQGIIIINILCFIGVNLIMGREKLFDVAQVNYAILDGEYWRLFSAMFFHADEQHILMNMIALLVIGASCERNLPKKHKYLIYISIYIISGLVGNLFTLWIEGPYSVSLGASGAIAGLQGCLIILIGFRNKNIQLYTVIFLVIFLIQSFSPGIGTWAHIFGILSGMLFGVVLKKKNHSNNSYQIDSSY